MAVFVLFWLKMVKNGKKDLFFKTCHFWAIFLVLKLGPKNDPLLKSGEKNGQKFLPPPKGCLVYLQKIGIFQKWDQRVPGLSTKKGPQKKPTPTQGPPFYTELVFKWGPKGAWFIYKKRAKIGFCRFWALFWGPKMTPFLTPYFLT